MKERSFIPNACEELREILESYLAKAEKRVEILELNDRENLMEQKRFIEDQMAGSGEISQLFSES